MNAIQNHRFIGIYGLSQDRWISTATTLSILKVFVTLICKLFLYLIDLKLYSLRQINNLFCSVLKLF